MKRLKILFTEGSSTSSREAIYCLGHHHAIDILDPSRFCQSRFSTLVRRWHRCPSYSRDPLAYLRFIVRLLRSEKYDVLFPTHEQIYLLSRAKEHLSKLVGLAVPDFKDLSRVYDKASFARLLEELDLPRPETQIVSTADELRQIDKFPRYLKLAHSTAGQGVWRVASKEELNETIAGLEQVGLFDGKHEILVQEEVKGIQEDAGGMFDHGRMISGGSCKGLVIGVGGASMQKLSTHRPDMVEHARRVGEHLNWQGPIGLAGITDEKTGETKYIEACPRIGESVHALICGVNPCESLVKLSLGERFGERNVGRHGVKTHQTFLNLVSVALAGGGRLDVMRELMAALTKRGMYASSEDELTRPHDDLLSLVPAVAVTALLLAYPRGAQWLVSTTVSNYALPSDGANRIEQISDQELDECFR